jgi:hypothetical protein
MRQSTEGTEPVGNELRLSTGVVLATHVTAEDLTIDTEHDPEGAEEFVILIRALRSEQLLKVYHKVVHPWRA